MRRLTGLIILFSIIAVNVHSQGRPERTEFDTVFRGGGYLYFHMDNTQAGYSGSNTKKNNFSGASIINSIESERKKMMEEERRAIEYYIDSMKVVLFTNTMGLSESEAAVFWPAYENYQNKLNEILEKRRDANAKLCDPFRKYKSREYLAFVNTEVKSYKEEAMLREQFSEKFKGSPVEENAAVVTGIWRVVSRLILSGC
jgi:hypothetical protein